MNLNGKRMSEPGTEDDKDEIDESGRTPTQRRIDEKGAEDVPVDEEWEGHS